MIKLQDLLPLKNLVYTEEIKPKHQKKMQRETEIFWPTLQLPYHAPPGNTNPKTLGELKFLEKVETNKDFVKEGDEIVKSFQPLIDRYEVNISSEYLEKVVKESAKFIMQLKYKYNTPRPYQIAEFYGIDLNGVELDSMKTPSYPSGHATQGYLVGEILTQFDPQNSITYRQKAEDIAHSRIVAKAHFPSDKIYGKKIGKFLFQGIRKWSL